MFIVCFYVHRLGNSSDGTFLYDSIYAKGFVSLIVQMDAKSTSISCFSVDGRIAKIEVMGSSASGLLEKILHPISR